jgi:disulfide bond formation protein DsbB
LVERIPYIVAIIIIILSKILKNLEKFFFILLGIIFLFAAILSFYHLGIEQGFIKESLICDLNSENNNLSKEELLKQLKESTLSCKNVTFRVFGLSLATINTLFSLLLSFINIKIFLNYEKN